MAVILTEGHVEQLLDALRRVVERHAHELLQYECNQVFKLHLMNRYTKWRSSDGVFRDNAALFKLLTSSPPTLH